MTIEISDEVRKILSSIRNKRAGIVINHILEYGQITTEELAKIGYNHPPRAARDVREAGIPLITIRVKSSDGRTIGAYKFGDFSKIRAGRLEGRTTFSRTFKEKLYQIHVGHCTVCHAEYEKRYLQVDHRVPYEVGGDTSNNEPGIDNFMLLCGSCNRAKSWSCEHCENWTGARLVNVCTGCYWANPENYTHIAQKQERRVAVVWTYEECVSFEWLAATANAQKKTLQEMIKYFVEENRRNDAD